MSALQIIISAILAVLVLAGISMMSKVRTAVAGNLLSAFAMLCGIVGTLFFAGVVSVWTIYVSILIGALIGSLLAARVQMIQMPQTVALFNGLGGGASALVGLLSVHGDSAFVRFTALLAVAVGMVTLVGSLIAAGKLHRVLPQKPVVWKGHALCTLLFLVLTLAFVVAGTFAHGAGLTVCLVGAFVSASLFGLWFSLRVGGADMPITIVGGIVGASGLLLTQIMCRAMNRKLMSILTGGTMKPSTPTPAIEENENEELVQRIMDLEKKIKELEAMVADLEARVQALDGQACCRSRRRSAHRCVCPLQGQGRHHRPRLRHGAGSGPAPGPPAGGQAGKPRRPGPLRHPPGRRPHAGAHERVAGRGGCRLREAV